MLDTGIDPTHPEVGGSVTQAVTFDARPEVWEARPVSPSIDTEGHGTHVYDYATG